MKHCVYVLTKNGVAVYIGCTTNIYNRLHKHRKDKDFDKVPIAILTAKSQEFDAMVGLHVMNADAYITKPFGKQELIDKTNELFKKNQ